MTAIQPTKRLTELKREAIVAAAVATFKERGVHGSSMDTIAARAEVSKRTLYNHFPSKNQLLEEITESIWEHSVESQHFPFSPDTSLREQLLTIVETEYQLLSNEDFIDMAKVFLTECINNPELTGKLMAHFDQSETGLNHWLQEAMDHGVIKSGPVEFISEQLLSQIRSLAFWPTALSYEPTPTPEEKQWVLESSVDMFLSYYAI